jgi:site-specific DNA recombinase
MTKRKSAIIYVRLSQDRTGESVGVARQVAKCRQLCERLGFEVAAVLVDNDLSATTGKRRPAFEELLESNPEVIVVWHTDRLIRVTRDLERVIDLGVNVHAVEAGHLDLSTPAGRAVARTVTAWAQYEGEQKSARQCLANADRASKGRPASGGVRPFGYADDRITVIQEEAEAIRRAARAALNGTPLSAIAREWGSAGLVSSRSGQGDAGAGWTPRGVKGVLVNPRYAGRRIYRGEDVGVGAWEPIIKMETHLALKATLCAPSRRLGTAPKLGRTPASLLTGIAVCDVCDQTVRASSVRGRLTYTCRRSHAHPPRERADAWVSARMVAYLSSPSVLAELLPTGDDDVDVLRSQVNDLHQRLDELTSAFAMGGISGAQLTQGTAIIRDQLAAAETSLSAAVGVDLLEGLHVGIPDLIAVEWGEMPLAHRRLLVGTMLDIRVRRIGRNGFRPADHMTVTLRRP